MPPFWPYKLLGGSRRNVRRDSRASADRLSFYDPTMVPEASLEQTKHGLVAAGEEWFVLNAREARWFHRGLGFGTATRPRRSGLSVFATQVVEAQLTGHSRTLAHADVLSRGAGTTL